MASPQAAAAQAAKDEWCERQRQNGAVVTVQGKNGKFFHVDDGFAQLIGHDTVPGNGFDIIPPEIAAEGAEAMAHFTGQAYRACFPFLNQDGGYRWVKLEGCWIHGLLVCAYWPEDDPEKQEVGSAPI